MAHNPVYPQTYPPNGFNWNWSDLSSNASLSDVISTVNWIGQNLDANYTDWIEANNNGLYNNIEYAKDDVSSAESAASSAAAAASAAQAAAAAAEVIANTAKSLAEWAQGKINRCSYLRGQH